MIRDPFVALLGAANLQTTAKSRELSRIAVDTLNLTILLDEPGCLLLGRPSGGFAIAQQGGRIFGDLYDRNPERNVPIAFDASISNRVRTTQGRTLISDYWGRYVAFVRGHATDVVHVIRDPSGAIPCYHAATHGLTVVASDFATLVTLSGLHATIDRDFVANLLAFPHLRGSRTGLVGAWEVPPGCCLHVAPDRVVEDCYWTPWSFTQAGSRIEDFDQAGELLRNEILHCVRRLATPYRKILLELSGGLDSSIIAASLAEIGAPVVGLNLATLEAEGDEQRYARCVADHSHIPLREDVARPIETVMMTRPPVRRLAGPGSQAWLQAWEGRFIEHAQDAGCDVFFSGTGGDNVFCSLNSAAPAADWLAIGHLNGAFLRTTRNVATIHRATLWTVLRFAVRLALRGAPKLPWKQDRSFLDPAMIPDRPEAHPWFDEPDAALPGDRSHIRSLLATVAHAGGSARDTIAPSIYPFLAQPVQELCLRIPAAVWVTGGRDRAVARHAFRDLLPSMILNRRTKGSIDGYCFQLLERNLMLVRTLLLDGRLASQGLIDRAALSAYFDARQLPRDNRYFRILALVDVEIWLRDWLDDAGASI